MKWGVSTTWVGGWLGHGCDDLKPPLVNRFHIFPLMPGCFDASRGAVVKGILRSCDWLVGAVHYRWWYLCVAQEFFMLLLREVLNPIYGMFKYHEESRFLWFNPEVCDENQISVFHGAISIA